MPLIKTSNPALGKNTFQNLAAGGAIDASARMTLNGTINKTGILLLCALATAAWTWNSFFQTLNPADVNGRLMIGAFGGMIFAFVTIFKKEWAPVTAPIYAALEGLVLGGLSAWLEVRYHGIAIEAVSLTFGTLFVMLFLYRTGIIKVTRKFMIGVVAATGAIMLFYFAMIVLSFFGIQFVSINSGTPFGILFSLFVVGIAALNLVLDFDFIEQGVTFGAPKYMEWYGAFGIMVTLVWLYLEMLRLLAKINSRR
jgi:uncharacterized YccA/Bax inhibitor family protein